MLLSLICVKCGISLHLVNCLQIKMNRKDAKSIQDLNDTDSAQDSSDDNNPKRAKSFQVSSDNESNGRGEPPAKRAKRISNDEDGMNSKLDGDTAVTTKSHSATSGDDVASESSTVRVHGDNSKVKANEYDVAGDEEKRKKKMIRNQSQVKKKMEK